MRPEVRYVENDGVNIAYVRYGRGENVIVYTPPFVSNVDLGWDLEEPKRVALRVAEFAQVIAMDKRGVGLSDRTDAAPTLEDRVADTLAVMDAEGVDRASLVGVSEGGAIAIAIAARHPDRVKSLLVVGAPLPGIGGEEVVRHVEPGDPPLNGRLDITEVMADWAKPTSRALEVFAPTAVDDPRIRAWWARFERQSASPGAARRHLAATLSIDIVDELDRVGCPAAIGHCRDDRLVPVAMSRCLASRWPDAKLMIWDGHDHLFEMSPNWREIIDDQIEWITGVRPPPATTTSFAVVLFTDIVDSTNRVATTGDDGWARLLRAHDATADRVIEEFGGRRVKSTGDGLLAVFADPERAVRAGHRLRHDLTTLGLDIRGGVHAGQVEEHDDRDVTGIVVNIAARIESVAPPGTICGSGTLRDLLAGTRIGFDSLGMHDLKGVDHPVEVLSTSL